MYYQSVYTHHLINEKKERVYQMNILSSLNHIRIFLKIIDFILIRQWKIS